jgi:DNA-binding LacI/PurR family transcriptional regulator
MDKLSGYKLGLCEAGLAFDPNLVVPARYFDAQDGYQATQTLLQRARDITAILYASDSLAIGGIRALSEAGLEVPTSISVVGFYNEAITQFTIPSLSSIHVNWQRIGTIAAQRLLTLLEPEQPDEERLRIVLPMHVILRDSIGPALHHENLA